ncbi:MAG: XrtA/PEP-CTERM system histidine kinase PrsK [Pseudomonadota bacterium]|nr:XrtA/PEP-CTERM system histidine kinase PrsK [Pseudomonadota bacterium]
MLNLVYFFAAFAGASLALYLLLVGRSYILRAQVIAIGAATTFWGGWSLIFNDQSRLIKSSSLLPEFFLMISCYSLVERLLKGPYHQSLPLAVRNSLRLVWVLAIGLIAVAFIDESWVMRILPQEDVLLLTVLILAFLGQALVTQSYADAVIEPKIQLINISAALTLFLSGMILIYGAAFLTGIIPLWLEGLRCLMIVLALYLFMDSVKGNSQWALAIFISPQARAYAPRVVTSAIAFIMLLAVSYLFQNPSENLIFWPYLITSLITFSLLIILFSGRLRKYLSVYAGKNFLPFRYDYRGEWLRLTDSLAASGPELPERSIKALAQIVESPSGALWLLDENLGPYLPNASWNMRNFSEILVPSDDPVIEFMRNRNWILDTADRNRRPDLYIELGQPDWLQYLPESSLIVPLLNGDNAIGFVVLMQPDPKFRLTFEEIDLLRTSGRQVAAHLAQYQSDRRLAQSEQFEAFNRLTAFVMHDLKNLIAQQSLMVKNASRHKDNPAFIDDSMVTIESSVIRMQKLLQQLQTGETEGSIKDVSLISCVKDAIEKCQSQNPEPNLIYECKDLNIHIDSERFTAILAHLIRNAQDATGNDGSVQVSLSRDEFLASIVIRDDGCGMEEEFIRSRLFRPFDTTKGSQGMGIGAYQARSFVVASGGSMIVRSTLNKGTTVDIQLPVAPALGKI